jgi:hypothetical protein
MTLYKIFEVSPDGLPMTLFHSVRGSRLLPRDLPIRADHRLSVDGSGQAPYWTSFHAFTSKADAEHYLKRFRRPRPLAICRITLGPTIKVRTKHKSRAVLVSVLTIAASDWAQRIPFTPCASASTTSSVRRSRAA